jgi:hypothetical protein
VNTFQPMYVHTHTHTQNIPFQCMWPHFDAFIARVMCGLSHVDTAVRALAIQYLQHLLRVYARLCLNSDAVVNAVIVCVEGAGE